MELKINIDGLERSVSGVTENTTCSQIIYALAHATSQRGRFVMVEKYRNVERRLAPTDRPLETLQKWREHAANVTFQMLRVDQNDAICDLVDEALPPEPSKPYLHPKQMSTSSMIASLPGKSAAGQQQQLENGQRSTSSLPTYTSTGVTGTLGRSSNNRRPPPPDYMSVMENKKIMLGAATFPQNDDFDDFQRADVNKLAETMTPQEIADYLVQEEELRQLLKQQKNLRAILKPMIAANWPQQYQIELKKSHKLKASLASTKEAIKKTQSDIKRVEESERELLKKLAEFKTEDMGDENSELSETSFDLGCSSTGTSTPQTLIA
ncbi:hypothetical protein L3Y34_011908 [Caenorhabditis briggsae]|uniref:Ras association domain-containing protein n=2 Tax=Caenorhabditis briggsae TaxID=6238 RepID=A0AAE8ZSW2_CAEBR|nr:hypothetical protein L3Y34_011908 [Caenorhabditis briggsae]